MCFYDKKAACNWSVHHLQNAVYKLLIHHTEFLKLKTEPCIVDITLLDASILPAPFIFHVKSSSLNPKVGVFYIRIRRWCGSFMWELALFLTAPEGNRPSAKLVYRDAFILRTGRQRFKGDIRGFVLCSLDKMLNSQRSLSELPKMSAASQVERAVLVSCCVCAAAARVGRDTVLLGQLD